MSRTWKDDVRHSPKRHPDAPFWAYRWWLKHGRNNKFNAEHRRIHNRLFRAKVKQAIREGREPPKWVRSLPWEYW